MKVCLMMSVGPREVTEFELDLPEACTVQDALAHSNWTARFPALAEQATFVSIWGRNATADAVLRDGDRLEICRDLRVDPKVARRERFVGQGARGAGLFSQRRPGSKAGY